MKRSQFKSPTTKRTALPLVSETKDGKVLMCPFCKPSHAIFPFQPSACGTMVEVSATQEVLHAKRARNIKCAKCGQGGGDMVKWQNAYIHTHDCSPEIKTMAEPPKYSKLAGVVYKMNASWVKSQIEKLTGRAVPVDEVTPDGVRTGTVLGHFFYRKI
jgi:hypothetical protein